MTADTATAEHFKGTVANFSYNPEWPIWTFVEYSNAVEFLKGDRKKNAEFLKGVEKELTAHDALVKKEAAALMKVSPAKAKAFLKEYNERAFRDAEGAVAERLAKIAPHKVAILADAIDSGSEATVDMVLFADKKLDTSKVDVKSIYAGLGRASIGGAGDFTKLAKPVKHSFVDVNGDGKIDLVLTFNQKALASGMLKGAKYDVWFYGTAAEKKPIVAFDTADIK